MNRGLIVALGLFLMFWAVACGSDSGIDLTDDDDDAGNGSDASGDTGGGADGDDGGSDMATGSDGTEGDAAADAAEDVPPVEESPFEECEDDDGCDGENDTCHLGVCVREPFEEAGLWEEEGDGYVPIDGGPNLDCWETPIELGEGPAIARMQGQVDLFGPESPTRNLCVTAYDQELFIPWFSSLTPVCDEFKDLDLRTQEPYINCFALDPCRCDDEDFTGNRGDAGDSLDDCYAEIGHCNVLEGALLETCRQNILDRTGIAADTFILGTANSEPYPENPDRTEGVYAISDMPTNQLIVLKVSGRMRRWRDTYEFNALLRAEKVNDDGDVRWDGNVITEGAWRTIPQSAGMPDPLEPDSTAIAGVVRDCGTDDRNPEQVSGVQVGFTNDPLTIAYFNGISSDTLPQPGQASTNKDGVYAALGTPPGPNRVSMLTLVDGDRVTAGVRDVFGMPFSVIIATFEGNFAVE